MADGGTPPGAQARASGTPAPAPVPGLDVPAPAPGAPAPAPGLDVPASTRGRQPGIREVLLVATAVVLTVLVAAAATALLPREGQAVVFDTPLLILVLVFGTAIVLWRILRSPGT